MLAKFCNFRKTKAYEWIGIILVIILSWTDCLIFQDLLNPSHTKFKQSMCNTRYSPAIDYTYLLNKDGTLTIHRLSDKKNFIVKLDKGEK